MTFKSVRNANVYSSEYIASNDDLLTQILFNLPLKSIARFRSVSKHWLSLISTTPQLALPRPVLALLLHHRNDRSHLDLFRLHHHETKPLISSFRPLFFLGYGPLRCIQSCNGLLLFSQCMSSKTIYHVCNPTTTHFATLAPTHPDSLSSPFVSIAHDPLISPFYKVVCLYSSTHTSQLAIYSSETRGWRLSADPFVPRFDPHSYKEGVFWNRAIHWITRRGSFRFQVEEEKMLENPMPPMTSNWEMCFKYFGVSGDSLYLINGADISRGHLNIYEMESDCSCWSLKHQVDIGNDLGTSFPGVLWQDSFHDFSIMFLAESNADGQEPFLVVQIESQVVCYNFTSGTSRKIYDLFSGSKHKFLMEIGACQYIESLSLV